jgi:membrane carboxypeptidase/penicillin-binding protein
MKEYMKDQPILSFPIPPGIALAKMNPNSGYVSSSSEAGGVYAAFAGSPPARRSSSYTRDDDSSGEEKASSSRTGEAFFKSDLF